MPRLVIAAVVAGAGATGVGDARLMAQETRAELAGCYDVTHGGSVPVPSDGGSGFEIPPRIQFSGTALQNPSATRIVVPEGALPSVHGFTSARIIGDSLHMSFGTGYIGVGAILGPAGEGWVGTARNWSHYQPRQLEPFQPRPIELTPVPCDSPPPVSIDVMRPLGRSQVPQPHLQPGADASPGSPLSHIGPS